MTDDYYENILDPLSPKQTDIVVFIYHFFLAKQYPPTITEIIEGASCKSAPEQVSRLIKKGWLYKLPERKQRKIAITPSGRDMLVERGLIEAETKK